jgi:hypothetical protein
MSACDIDDAAFNASIQCKCCEFRHHKIQNMARFRQSGGATQGGSAMMNALESFADAVGSVWGSLTTELVLDVRRQLESLVRAPASESWLAALLRDMPAREELYIEPTAGFVLLAHAEHAGLYRPPHDHGRGWVIYAVLRGEVEMGTYARIEGRDGVSRLVKRDATLVRSGEIQVYLPGDIHDTLCVTGSALLLRFSDRDLQHEDRIEHRVTRYVLCDGAWTASAR